MPTIAQLKGSNIHLAYPIGYRFAEEYPFEGRPEFSSTVFFEFWLNVINSGVGVLLVAIEDDKVVGAFGGVISRDFACADLTASEVFFYVDEGSRGLGIGRALVGAYEEWAKISGATVISMVHMVELGAKKAGAMYHTLGYQPHDVVYFKRLPPAPPATTGDEVG